MYIIYIKIRLRLAWLEYIFKFSFINRLLRDKSALLPHLTAYFTGLREKCAQFELCSNYMGYINYMSRFKILSNPVK